MVEAGEANALVAERVWAETEKALGEPRPDVFISVLRECGALRSSTRSSMRFSAFRSPRNGIRKSTRVFIN